MPLIEHKSVASEQQTTTTTKVLLAIAMVINASNPAVFKRLQSMEPDYVYDCNVLCATNLIGLVTLPLIFRRDLTCANVRRLSARQWAALVAGTALFQVVGPFFFLKGLAGSSVAEAAILARLDSVEFYLLSLLVRPHAP